MKRLIFVFLTVILSLNFFSCSQSYNKSALCNTLFSDYTFEADFTFSVPDESFSGKAKITKEDTVKIEVLSPEPYVGLCAKNDYDGNAEYISFSYSGIEVDMPSEAFSKINMALLLFSPRLAEWVSDLPRDNFSYSKLDTGENAEEICVANLEAAGMEINIFYEEQTGMPLRFIAKEGNTLLNIAVNKFQITD